MKITILTAALMAAFTLSSVSYAQTQTQTQSRTSADGSFLPQSNPQIRPETQPRLQPQPLDIAETGILKSEVRDYNGIPALYLNDRPVVPMIYALTDRPSGKWSFESAPSYNIGQFAKAGIKLFQLDIWFEEMLPEDGPLDITPARKQIAGVLAKCPDAAVMFRLQVKAPKWWLEQHPEEWVRYADTDVIPEPYKPSHQVPEWQELTPIARVSYASEAWQKKGEEILREFCEEMSATPEGKHLMGIQIANGINGEHHQWAFVKHDPDTSEPMLRFFRNYLKEKYGTEKALRKAWNDQKASFETVEIPGMERHHTSEGIFRDPEREMAVSDYYEALHKSVTRSILSFARVIKETWPNPIAVGSFYGYYLSMFGRQAAGGHLCEEDILNSSDIDFICAPQAYNKNSRLPGGPGLSRGLIESIRLHGKLWLSEMDQPTHYGYVILGGLQKYPLEESVQIMRKFVLEPFVRGAGMWFYDFGPVMSSGWWDHPVYMDEIAGIRALEERYFSRQGQSPADVLMVFDTKVFLHTATLESDDPITDIASVNVVPIEAFKSGASVATCYLSDLPRMDLSPYKAVVFVNCYLLSEQYRRWIRTNVAGGGRSLIWLTAPGYNDGHRLDVRQISETVNMHIGKVVSSTIPDMKFSAEMGSAVQEGSQIANLAKTVFTDKKEGARAVNQPFFYVDDRDACPLAEMTDESGTVLVGGAVKVGKNSTDYFFTLPLLSGGLWRNLFEKAGCHIYDRDGDAVFAGSGMIMIHTKDGGPRIITLRSGRTVSFEMSPMETLLIDAESGEVL